MDGSYIENRFGIVMEDINDSLKGIVSQLEQLNVALTKFNSCIEDRTPIKAIRVADINPKK